MTHEQLFNASEQQLANFCQANINNSVYIDIKGQGNFQHVSPVGLNICVVSVRILNKTTYYYFGCIRVHVYVELHQKFDRRVRKH
jgi:hypothetical protein